MPKLILVLLSCILILASCNDRDSKNINSIHIDPYSANEVKVSSFISDVEYLRLSSDKGAQIGAIDKLVLDDGRIYVLDSYISVGLFVYDMNGELLFRINRYGRGPGEFMGPYDFAIDKEQGEIAIYDARGTKISFYNLKDGSFVEDKLMDFRFRKFEILEDSYVFYTDNRPAKDICCNIIITDKNLTIKQEYLEIKPGMRGTHFQLPNNFTRYNKGYFFTAQSDHNVYKITEGNIGKHLNIDFGEHKLPKEYFEKYDSYKARWKTAENAVKNISNYMETSSYLFFNYWFKDDIYYFLSLKKKGQTYHTNGEKLVNDLNIGPEIVWPVDFTNDKFVWVQQPNWLFKYLSNKKNALSSSEWKEFKKNNKKLISFSKSLSEGDENPYLMFTSMKIE